jgi:mono/diheme cytochrome c family protein
MRRVNPFVWIVIVFTVIGLIPLLPAQADEGETKSAKALFHQYCLDCHGPQMDGRGSLRPFLEQDPANLNSQATQAKTDQELFSIIKNGGGVEMHGWADTFTEEQIFSLVRYLRVLAP